MSPGIETRFIIIIAKVYLLIFFHSKLAILFHTKHPHVVTPKSKAVILLFFNLILFPIKHFQNILLRVEGKPTLHLVDQFAEKKTFFLCRKIDT